MKIDKRTWICWGGLAVLLLISLIPLELTLAPMRNFQIVDSNGCPISNAIVRQVWYQYALNFRLGADLEAGSKGEVFLPPRAIRTSGLSLISGSIKEIFSLGFNASLGSHESIGVFAKNYKSKWIYDGKGLEAGVVIMEREK